MEIMQSSLYGLYLIYQALEKGLKDTAYVHSIYLNTYMYVYLIKLYYRCSSSSSLEKKHFAHTTKVTKKITGGMFCPVAFCTPKT